jgi:hypothetical protein
MTMGMSREEVGDPVQPAYIVVFGTELKEVVCEVQDWIRHGYIPQGGIIRDNCTFYQAMARRDLVEP